MAISSLIIDVAPDAEGASALAVLAADGRISLGPRAGDRIAIVADTASAIADTELYQQLERLPGIRLVTLVQVYLDDQPVPAGCGPAHL